MPNGGELPPKGESALHPVRPDLLELLAQEARVERRAKLADDLVEADCRAAEAIEANDALHKVSVLRDPLFDEATTAYVELQVADQMVAAGKGLVAVLERVIGDGELWRRLSEAEFRFSKTKYRRRVEIAELLDQDLPSVLGALGYAPPPPAHEWATRIQSALLDAIARDSVNSDEAIAYNAAMAREQLIDFSSRLTRQVDEATRHLTEDRRELRRLRNALGRALHAGRERLIPAAIAAAITAVAFEQHAPAVTIGVGALAAGQTLLSDATQMAATAAIAKLPPHHAEQSAVETLAANASRARTCVMLLGSVRSQHRAGSRFLARRAVYAMLQDGELLDAVRRARLSELSARLMDLFEAEPFDVSSAEDLVAKVVELCPTA
jgi:hypothetical protein